MTPQMKIDVASEVQRAVPPVAVIAVQHVTSMTLNDWVMVATLGYIALQAGWLLWKWYRALSTKGWSPREED